MQCDECGIVICSCTATLKLSIIVIMKIYTSLSSFSSSYSFFRFSETLSDTGSDICIAISNLNYDELKLDK